MKIEVLSNNINIINQVVELGTKNSKTLGHFPEGAFHEYAQKGNILVAYKGRDLIGYLLFSITDSKRIIRIVHLCIKDDYRKQGIAKGLLNFLKFKYSTLLKGMSLSCRKDYLRASKFWESYGFKAIGSRRSRSKKENYLIRWYYDFGNEDLFSTTYDEIEKIRALLDANVLIKLRERFEGDQTGVNYLLEDWLEEVEYYYAPEIFNEINRDLDRERAERTRVLVRDFVAAKFKPDRRDGVLEELKKIIPGSTINDVSDKKQLSECIAAEISYFITDDGNILNSGEEIYRKFEVQVLRPIDFILLIDQLNNSSNYYSQRLAGVRYDYKKVRSKEVDFLVQTFLSKEKGEKKHVFRDIITSTACDLKKSEIKVVQDRNKSTLAIWGAKFCEEEVGVKFIRTAKSRLASTLFKQLIYDLINLTILKEKYYLVISDPFISESDKNTLESYGFVYKDSQWIKIVLKGVVDSKSYFLENKLVARVFNSENIMSKLNNGGCSYKHQIERMLFPLKFEDLDIPTYIIPIKPFWSGQLFDYYTSEGTLFGAPAELSWNRENVYYRSVRPVSEKSPGRILWYASKDSTNLNGRGSCIVGTSYIDSVTVGKPKELFNKFKKFGVYEWKHVYDLAKNDIENDIKALEFSDTEVFKKPVRLDDINNVLQNNGRRKNTFASPLEVNNKIFNDIYRIGIKD
ncbi:GNAT family N-acetyltransferase [Snuella lapsa]|uniref:N-acetyltransferase domain-containing protein n=1 Tax=Snuella lapsa TaxID=870481 RepID=A0ABP6Y941_9FLAO